MGSSFGQMFKITTYGESHGPALGVVIDGCPPKTKILKEAIQQALNKRRPGQSSLTTPRKEKDHVMIESGVEENLSTGTPIALRIENHDFKKEDYTHFSDAFRPSHADYTYQVKYGHRSKSGGGRASARETAARVAAGAVAKAVLEPFDVEVVAWVEQIGNIFADIDPKTVSQDMVEHSHVRCPNPAKAKEMIQAIEAIKSEGDSLGGVIRCLVKNPIVGLGSPVFDKIEADLAKAMLSLPATKGFEIGSGFAGTRLRGSEHNDTFVMKTGQTIGTETNRSGGVQGGITNGEPIDFKVAFKPTATVQKKQQTVTSSGQTTTLEPKGRHDPCVLPRAVPIVEAMTWLTLCDHWLMHRAQCG